MVRELKIQSSTSFKGVQFIKRAEMRLVHAWKVLYLRANCRTVKL